MCLLVMTVYFPITHPASANGATEPDIEELSLQPEDVGWSQLELGASRLGLSVSVDISLQHLQDATASHNLAASDQGKPVSAHRGDVMLMVFHAVSLGKELETSLWFDGRNAAALQRIRHVKPVAMNVLKSTVTPIVDCLQSGRNRVLMRSASR